MSTLRILQARARRSLERWRQHETEQNARQARIDLVIVAICQLVESARAQRDVLDSIDRATFKDIWGTDFDLVLEDLDDAEHEERITRLAHLLHGDADHEVFGIVDRWFDEDPEDDVIEQLRSALAVLEGSPGVIGDHWLLQPAVSAAN